MNDTLQPSHPFWIKVPFMPPVLGRKEWKAILSFRDSREELREVLKYEYGVKHVVLLNHARDGLYLGLKAYGWPVGSEVIMPSFVCRTVVAAVVQAGLVPHYVDIGDDYNMTLESTKAAIRPNTKAIILVYQFGKLIDPKPFQELCKANGLILIDDAATTLNAGNHGDFGLLSFNIGKQINATGGGALLTDNDKLFSYMNLQHVGNNDWKDSWKDLWIVLTRMKWIRATSFLHALGTKVGLIKKVDYDLLNLYKHKITLVPKTMSKIQSRLTISQFARCQAMMDQSLKNAELYNSRLQAVGIPNLDRHNGLYYTITCSDRYALAQYLGGKGIMTQWTFMPLSNQDQFKDYPSEPLPNTERLWTQTLSLPVGPHVSTEDVIYIADLVNGYVSK